MLLRVTFVVAAGSAATVGDDDNNVDDDVDVAVVVAATTVSVLGRRGDKDDDDDRGGGRLSRATLGRNMTSSSRRNRRFVSRSAAESYTRWDHEATISKAIVIIIPTTRFDAGGLAVWASMLLFLLLRSVVDSS
jgi:predicted nucleotidyltransferase